MYRLGRVLAWITNMTTIAGGLAIAFMMLHISADVLARFLFDTPLPGTITIVSNYYMIIAAFIPLAFAEQKEAHISVEVLTERLPAAVQKHLAGWMLLFSMTIFALLAVRTWGEAMAKYRIGASVVQGDTSISIWPTYYMLPIGCTLYLMEQFNPAKALDIIDKYGITSTFGFDAHWQGMSRAPNFPTSRFTITKAVIAGEPKTYDLVRGMCPPGATVNNLYAQTENGPGVSFGDHDCMDYEINKHTHGRPLPGVQLIIKCLDTGERLPQGLAGEICYKSPFMFRGYHKQEQETNDSFDAEGYFHSGDFGSFDNGYITFLGRLGGVIKSGGENVSTLRVTNLLLELFKEEFDDVKTIGIPDAYWGTKVVSFVRTLADQPLQSTPELRERCKGFMAAYEIPQEFIAWKTEWPMSPEGKIDFKILEQEAVSRLAPA